MNKEKAKELLPAIIHFAEGGNLRHAITPNDWYIQNEVNTRTNSPIENIIEDKHFEARKAFALGEEIEVYSDSTGFFSDCNNPSWNINNEYRPKFKEPVYEWQYNSYNNISNDWTLTRKFFIDEPDCKGWIKFEPSRRIKK